MMAYLIAQKSEGKMVSWFYNSKTWGFVRGKKNGECFADLQEAEQLMAKVAKNNGLSLIIVEVSK
jgi:cold shock CspA family protein